MSYRIVRYFSDNRPAKRVKVVATLAEAKAHCSRPETQGFVKARGPMREGGVNWFDGFVEIKRKGKVERGPKNLINGFKI